MQNDKIPTIAIACCSASFHIGLGNNLLGHVPGDLRWFKHATRDSAIIVGYNTALSIGRALAGRQMIVVGSAIRAVNEAADVSIRYGLSREQLNDLFSSPNVHMADNIKTAVELARDLTGPGRPVFVAGGGKTYEQAFKEDLIDEVYLTVAHGSLVVGEGDARFPIEYITPEGWKKESVRPLYHNEDGSPSRDLIEFYKRKSPDANSQSISAV